MTDDLPSGSEFPDLNKAGLGKRLDDFIKGMMNDDREFFQLAQEKKQDLRKQKSIDYKSFIQSQSAAIERGNQNACDARHNHEQIATKQLAQIVPTVIPGVAKRSPLTKGKTTTKMPKTRSATPTKGSRSRPSSISRFKLNQATSPPTDPKPHFIQPIDANNSPEKSKRNLTQFERAQRGERGTSVGDRAIVFSANGTPHYGDSYLDRNVAENLSANQATSNPPISKIPDKIQVGKAISANPLQQQPRANVAPKSDTTANLIVLGTIAAAVTAVLFFFQHVLIFVQMILQVSTVTSTITNISSSFVAILNNIGSLFGLGEGLIDPLSQTFDSMLNNVFGKDKVDYVKYQFAKISAVYVAGKNIYEKVTNASNSIGKVTEDNANNTSKIGNALKAMGMMASGEGWMNEDNKVNPTIGGVGAKLENISGLASSLSEITNDVKSAKEEVEKLDKEQSEKEKEGKENQDKATEKNEDKEIADLDKLGDVA